jgi:ribose transport system permease protein
MKKLLRSDEIRMLVLNAVLVLVFAFAVDGFFQEQTAVNILDRSTTTGLLALGLAVCLITGEIDLSIGANLALSGVVFTTLQTTVGIPLAILGGVASGLAIGVVNALLVNYLGVISFVATLGSMLLARGVALVVAHGTPVPSDNFPAALAMSRGLFGPITPPVLVFIALIAIGQMLITNTRYGRELVAVGSDPRAAEDAGVPRRRRRNLAFLVCGLSAAVAGVMLSISLASGSPTVGDGDLLAAAAAVFLSGVALSGGRGSLLAAALASVALSVLAVGLQLWGLPDAYQQIVTGALIVLVGVPWAVVAARPGLAAGLALRRVRIGSSPHG